MEATSIHNSALSRSQPLTGFPDFPRREASEAATVGLGRPSRQGTPFNGLGRVQATLGCGKRDATERE